MIEEVPAFVWGEVWDEFADAVPEAFNGSFGVLSQMGLEFGEGLFDRVEVRRVRRQIAQHGSRLFDEAAHLFALVRTEIVHDDDVAFCKRRDENLGNISLEAFGVHGSVQNHRRRQAIGAQAGGEGGNLPVAVGNATLHALTAQAAAVTARHVGGAARLIDEDELSRVEPLLIQPPDGAGGGHVRARLLAGQHAFF